MGALDQNRYKNKTGTSVSAIRVAALTSREQRIEDEREEFDVRRLMRLQREGKPFRKYLSVNDSDVLGAKEIMPTRTKGQTSAKPRFEFSPRGRTMRRHLDEMRRLAKEGLGAILAQAPSAPQPDELIYWWGALKLDLARLVRDWGEHARACKARGEPVPTPAYWLLIHRTPISLHRAEAEAEAMLESVWGLLAPDLPETKGAGTASSPSGGRQP